MAVTTKVFDKFVQGQANGAHFVDFDTDTIKVMLTTSTYTPNQDTHEFKSDVTNEVSDSTGDYVAGGKALTTKVINLDTTSDFVYLSADNPQWLGCTFTARIAVLYKDTGTGSTSPLIGWIDFGANQVLAAQDFRIVWANAASGGVVKIATA
jgi:hypothetical protein